MSWATGPHTVWAPIITVFRLLARNKGGLVGLILLLAILSMVLIGPLLIPLDTRTKVDRIYLPPSWENLLGTDHQGRDIWSHIVHGGRDLLYVAFLAGLISTLIAITFGSFGALLAGLISTLIAITFGSFGALLGGRFDTGLMALTDLVLTIPQVVLLIVLAGFVKLNNATFLALLLGGLNWPTLLRAVRAQVLSLKQRDYIEAARALDLGNRHIIFSEVLPNMMSYIVISFALAMTSAIYAQVGLVFLGLVPLSSSNWAVMINLAWVRGAFFYKNSVWYIMSPVMAVILFQLAVIWTARGLEGLFNPRLRTGE